MLSHTAMCQHVCCNCCRTAYTNADRVYQVNFLVTDASTPTLQDGNWYSRQIRLPPLWTYQVSKELCTPTCSCFLLRGLALCS